MVLKIAQALRSLHRGERGFTLIELLIVIAILAVLAAIAMPLVVNRVAQAREYAHAANIAILQRAVELYNFDCGQYPQEGEGFQGYLLEDKSGGEDWKGPYIGKTVDPPEGCGPYKLISTESGKYVVIGD